MEIVLNFDEKEFAVIENCGFNELQKRLKKLLGGDLRNWTIAGQEVKWVNQYWPTVLYQGPTPITWRETTTGPYEITCGDQIIYDTVVCFSDNKDHEEEG